MLVPNVEQMVWLTVIYRAGETIGWPMQVMPEALHYNDEGELEEREATLGWLAENGWVDHTPGEEFDLVELTDLATENMETITAIVKDLRR
jgi:hypothetical protein